MPTTFGEILPVQSASSHVYEADLKDEWCIGSVPNGGYVTSAFMVVARTHMQKTHASRSQSDVINLHLEFLRRTSAGAAAFKVKDVKIGSRISNLHIVLTQRKNVSDPKSPWQDEVTGYFTISTIDKEDGPSHATKHKLASPTPLPVSLKALSANKDQNYIRRREDPYNNFRRASKNVQMHLLKPSARPRGLSMSVADQWVRFTPLQSPDGTGRWTNDSLGLLVDIFPQLHERFVNQDLEDMLLSHHDDHSDQEIRDLVTKKTNNGMAAFWYPTLLLNLDVKTKLPEQGVEWLFVRVQAKRFNNGRFDLAIEVWDDPLDGQLVAISSHAALVVDAARNMKRDGNKSSRM